MWQTLRVDGMLAFRNLLRQRQRTAFGVGAVVFGVVAMMFAAGFIDALLLAMREGTIRSRLGHVQIAAAGYLASGRADPFAHVLPSDAPELTALRARRDVRQVASRIEFSGLVSRGDETLSFLGEGIEPEREVELSEAIVISRGTNLDAGVPNGVILGDGLARNLGAEVGDRLVLLVSRPGGGIDAVEVEVRGFFITAFKAFDDVAIRTNLGLAQRLLHLKGAHIWVVALDRTEHTDRAAAEMAATLDPGRFDVVPWHRLADFYRKTVRLFSRQVTVVKVIIAVLILLVVSNAIAMSVRERTAEIGTSLAMGVRPARIMRQFLIEGVLLGLIGGTIGAVIGTGVNLAVSAVGISMPPPPGLGRGFTAGVEVGPGLVAEALLLAGVTAVVAGLMPAWRASRLAIVDALRHGR
jgi:putative ABC transport system permease protein